ncbi:MAG: hypothetical protein HY600_07260 [Candidatus Omnitrophica bacterium]|nr:hypothetical protein [Candidatus Omnitrophota bacterium]
MGALARRLTGPFSAALGEELPTRETVVAAVAEALTAEPVRYGVFTAALDQLGPAVDPQALAMLCGRLLVAWTEPSMTAREDIAHRLATLIVALPPEEQTRRRRWLGDNFHDVVNAWSAIQLNFQALRSWLPSGMDIINRLVAEEERVLATVATGEASHRWKQGVDIHHDVASVFTTGALLASEYYGALRRVTETWSPPPVATLIQGSAHPSRVRAAMDYLQWGVPRAMALSRVTLDDLAGVPHPVGPLDLTQWVHDLAPYWDVMARQHGVRSTAVTVPPRPLWGRANPVDLERAVGNLVANVAEALKRERRTQEGRIEITAALEGPWVTLTVQDNGPGLPDDVLTPINQPEIAEQVPSAKPPDIPGQHGLGLLSVKRRVVEAWNGQLGARNRPEGGTEIVLRLPAVEPPAPVPPSAATGLEEMLVGAALEPALRERWAVETLGVEA